MLDLNAVEKARGFYDAVLLAIGGKVTVEYLPHAFCCELRGGGRVWVATPFNEETAVSGNGNMVRFSCETKEEVDAAHRIALAQGGTNEGDPSPQPLCGPDFYGAYVRDLDGNKMSFVDLGESQQ
jgi:hypothetical protein